MSIPVLGWVFIPSTLLALRGRRSWVPWLLSAAMPFSQSDALILGHNTIQPFYIAAFAPMVFVIRDIFSRDVRPRSQSFESLIWWTVAYIILATLTLPFIFNGIGVLLPRGGLDEEVLSPGKLAFSISNVAQTGYFILASFVVIFFARIANPGKQYLSLGFGIGTVFNFWAYIAWMTGFPFPSKIFDTDPQTIYYANYDSGARIRGIFAEPSQLATFSIAALVFFLFLMIRSNGKRRFWSLAAFIANCLILAAAFSGIAVVAVGTTVALILAIYGMRFVMGRSNLSPWIVFLALVTLVIAVLQLGPISQYLDTLVGGKLESSSFSARDTSNWFSVGIIDQTWGFGVGLGSSRPSSFLALLGSNIGIIGTTLFAAIVVIVIRAAWRNRSHFEPAMWSLLAVLAAKVAGQPDMSLPILWMSIAACAVALPFSNIRSMQVGQVT